MRIDRVSDNNAKFLSNNRNLTFGATPKVNGLAEQILNAEILAHSKFSCISENESPKILQFLGDIVKSVAKSPKQGIVDIFVERNAVIGPAKCDVMVTMERPPKETGCKNKFDYTQISFQEILDKPKEMLENAKKWINL